jgi:hypothetical protein
MEKESEKYRKVIEILKQSKPVLNSPGEIEDEVMRRIRQSKQPKTGLSDIVDFLFGWVYIGWVRNSLVAASVFLVAFFIWQQSVILKRVDYLSKQTIISSETLSDHSDEIEKGIMLFKLSGRSFPSRTITISEKQMDQLLDSVNALQVKYKDLINLINDDPELKNSIERKLKEHNQQKSKL